MSAEAEIRRRILHSRAITFAEFMDVALFWPQGGYYLGPPKVGASGDFYTSPHAHPAFGALLAVQLHQMWRLMGEPAPFTVVEMGAGNGLLCRDLLDYASNLPGNFARSLRYICMDHQATAGAERDAAKNGREPGVTRIAAEVPALIPSGPSDQWRLLTIPLSGVRGCYLSNEFLDALPVHQVTCLEGYLKETYVTLQGDELATTLDEPSTPALADRLESLGIELVEGQTAEISLGVDNWTEQVAGALDAGFVLTIDYGHFAPELYSAESRPRGTLTTYYRHTQTDAPLQRIGRQDMTAQVDFTTVAESGRRFGLEPLGLASQRRFLANLGLEQFRRRLNSMGLDQRRFLANNAGMLDIARPGGLGDFKVLLQSKNVARPALWGFTPLDETVSEEAAMMARELPVPLLRKDHVALAEARYPHAGMEFDQPWPEGGHEL